MIQYGIIIICQKTINIINFAREAEFLFIKQGTVKEKVRICFNMKVSPAKWFQSILKTMFEFALTKVS